MKKTLFAILCMSIAWAGCKKEQVKEEVNPEPTDQPSPKHFLKAVNVSGNSEVRFDSTYLSYAIALPADTKGQQLDLQLSLPAGIQLLDDNGIASRDTVVPFQYAGQEPKRLVLVDKKGERQVYTIFVALPGPIKAELTTTELSLNRGPIILPVKWISGVGTIPAHPEHASAKILLRDPSNGYEVEGSFTGKQVSAYIPDATRLLQAQRLTLEIQIANNPPIKFDNIRFKRGIPMAFLVGYDNVLVPAKDSMEVSGGFFIPGAKYTAVFTSDFLAKPVSQTLTRLDSSRVAGPYPTSLPEGSYLVTLTENDNLMGQSSVYLSSVKQFSIETIWKGNPNDAFLRNTAPIELKKGERFFAKPWPPKYAMQGRPDSDFSVDAIPQLRLKAGASVMDLKPKLRIYSWAVAGVKYSFGEYTIPADLAAGSYEASLVFPGGEASKPYWSKITVR